MVKETPDIEGIDIAQTQSHTPQLETCLLTLNPASRVVLSGAAAVISGEFQW